MPFPERDEKSPLLPANTIPTHSLETPPSLHIDRWRPGRKTYVGIRFLSSGKKPLIPPTVSISRSREGGERRGRGRRMING